MRRCGPGEAASGWSGVPNPHGLPGLWGTCRAGGDSGYQVCEPQLSCQLERLICHFVGRGAMDIKGFGAVYVHDLIAEGYLKDVADIFTLSQYREELIQKGIVGKVKNTDKLLAAIEKAKQNPPDRLLTGLGISNVGKSAAQALMNHFGTMDALARQRRRR